MRKIDWSWVIPATYAALVAAAVISMILAVLVPRSLLADASNVGTVNSWGQNRGEYFEIDIIWQSEYGSETAKVYNKFEVYGQIMSAFTSATSFLGYTPDEGYGIALLDKNGKDIFNNAFDALSSITAQRWVVGEAETLVEASGADVENVGRLVFGPVDLHVDSTGTTVSGILRLTGRGIVNVIQ